MINRFMVDLKKEQSMSPPSPSSSFSVCEPYLINDKALDLSRRRDSIETLKSSSPYNTSSSIDEELHTNRCSISPNHSKKKLKNLTSAIGDIYSNDQTILNQQMHSSIPLYPIYNRKSNEHQISPSTTIKEYQNNSKNLKNSYNLGYIRHIETSSSSSTIRDFLPKSEKNESDDTISDGGGSQSSLNCNINNNTNIYPKILGRSGKLTRPFKAYPRDPLAIAASFSAADSILDTQSAEKFNLFRKRMLEQIHAANGGQRTVTNPKMSRNNSICNDEEKNNSDNIQSNQNNDKDEQCVESSSKDIVTICGNNNNLSAINRNKVIRDASYFEKRRKNNAAAKKSRDLRRIKEDEIAIRAAFLERENIQLKIELAAVKKQLTIYGMGS